MRKYTKPEIFFEDFTLSTNIAACAVSTNFSKDDCSYFDSSLGYLFLSGIPSCIEHVEDDGTSGFCYHVPTDSQSLFSS